MLDIELIDFEISLKKLRENNIILHYFQPNMFSKEKMQEGFKQIEKMKIGLDSEKVKENLKKTIPKNIDPDKFYDFKKAKGVIYTDNNLMKLNLEILTDERFLFYIFPHDYINFDKILNNFNDGVELNKSILEKIDFDFETDILTIDYKKIKINSLQSPPLYMYIVDYIFKNGVKEKHYFSEIFNKDKVKNISKKEIEKSEKIAKKLGDKEWYILNDFVGTSEEIALMEFIASREINFKDKYKEFFLLRNEEVYKIYDFEGGGGFQPDFILFLKGKTDRLHYQIFIEPKADNLIDNDKWKNNFLKQISEKYGDNEILKAENKEYKLIGIPFFNEKNNGEFKKEFEKIIKK